MSHDLELDEDFQGWVTAHCECGWQAGPFPGRADAIDAWGDHRSAVGEQGEKP